MDEHGERNGEEDDGTSVALIIGGDGTAEYGYGYGYGERYAHRGGGRGSNGIYDDCCARWLELDRGYYTRGFMCCLRHSYG